MNYLYITVGRVKKTTGKILVASLAMSTLSLGLSALLMTMTRMGLTGVALGWLAGQSVVALVLTVPILRQTRS
jgi:Na+-driven multidrug efflux pump